MRKKTPDKRHVKNGRDVLNIPLGDMKAEGYGMSLADFSPSKINEGKPPEDKQKEVEITDD